MTEHLEIVIIEIPKAIREYKKNNKDKISQWMMFLENPNQKEVLKIMDENEDIKEAVDELSGMSNDEELRRIAELREKAIRDEHAAISLATKRGLEKGLEEGIKLGIEQGKEQGIRQGLEQEKRNQLVGTRARNHRRHPQRTLQSRLSQRNRT